uniref:Uncharacterized protein n=1 Tax=Chromera velia CCMP2878 TaxID=1169474 RepID=A0A0G4HB92_9ALVE|eukprot:Cvel_25769.t1-p1 / transcript=Cvel_25769.t1 / gene=Cvel_25769 / organism=Chromera_velia_CCMP2878 / gene_product=hypothetical protein / transcript_product=hypothetical protein / location=Cvel_scaffold2968:17973-18395(+) / protein_length=141 / sequence_SO=supercontig / SO=protein_coding / is_pseudo=false
MRIQPNPQGATLAQSPKDSASLPSSADAALTLLQEQEAAAFVPLFGPDPMTKSLPNIVTIPASLPPADLPAVYATDPSLSSQPTQQPIPESAPPASCGGNSPSHLSFPRHAYPAAARHDGDWSFPRAFTPVGRRNPWYPAE